MDDQIFIPGIGQFEFEHGSCQHVIPFRGQSVAVLIYPNKNGSEPRTDWPEFLAGMLKGFLASVETELKKLPAMVRQLCRDYDMYEFVPIPWTDEELLDGLEWSNIKLCNEGIIECCTKPAQKPMNNFTIVIGFDSQFKLEFAHFDG